jgi:hypothetical protein
MGSSYRELTNDQFTTNALEDLQKRLFEILPMTQRCQPWLADWLLYRRHKPRKGGRGGKKGLKFVGESTRNKSPREHQLTDRVDQNSTAGHRGKRRRAI